MTSKSKYVIMENGLAIIVVVSIVIVVAIGIFFLCRAIMTWYWRIDEIVNNQSHQSKLIYEQNQLLRQALGIRPADSSMPKEEIERKAKLFDQTQK